VRALAAADLRPVVVVPSEARGALKLPVTVEIGSGQSELAIVETRPSQVSVVPLRGRNAP
jgi:hypothetical protein